METKIEKKNAKLSYQRCVICNTGKARGSNLSCFSCYADINSTLPAEIVISTYNI